MVLNIDGPGFFVALHVHRYGVPSTKRISMKIPHKIPIQTAATLALLLAQATAWFFGLWPLAVSLSLILVAVVILNWAMNNKRETIGPHNIKLETTRVDNPFRPDGLPPYHYIELDVDEFTKPKSFYERWIDRHPSRTIPPEPPPPTPTRIPEFDSTIAVVTGTPWDYELYIQEHALFCTDLADNFTRALRMDDIRGKAFRGVVTLASAPSNPNYSEIMLYITSHFSPYKDLSKRVEAAP